MDNVTAEDVLSKLKDDGDFDNLRLQIIRHLKHNEDLRDNIIAMVKQSATLARPGAEYMKPRQLSDAIHEEVGEKLMSQISDSLWSIIKSPDGMNTEITETVESVYNKLSNPLAKKLEDSPSIKGMVVEQNQKTNMKNQTQHPNEVEDLSDAEPPGFSSSNHYQNYRLKQSKEELDWDMTYRTTFSEGQNKKACLPKDETKLDFEDQGPPGFSTTGSFKQPIDLGDEDPSDEDPDVPPGFG